ncbi:hypothetical protein SAMN04487787_101630 [Kosakonia sacchari]|nr:hypothetical protein SAMN04487787_101630 [Kosakonia sacchari]
MMPFATEQKAVVFPVHGRLYDSHGDYSRAMMVNESSESGAFMTSEEGDLLFNIKAIEDSINSGFLSEPEWVITDQDFITWVRGFSTDGE